MSSVSFEMSRSSASGPDGNDRSPRAVRLTPTLRVWVLCRKAAGGDAVENVRAYDDEARAQADLELAESVSPDEFWLAAVPFLQSETVNRGRMSSVQRLALTWLAQGAEAEVSIPETDPVVISPRHVRGFVSVPPDEWHEMEERGWVRNGLITPEGQAQIDGSQSSAG